MATRRKAKTTKLIKKDETIPQKVFLCGNCYSKLSGMFITSLDNTKAISEWNSIPYLSNLYGAELIGYTTNLENPTNSENFVSKDSSTRLEPNEIYYPVYQNKKYEVSEDKRSKSYTYQIYELCSDLQWLNEENINLTISVDNQTFPKASNLKIDFSNDQSDITLLQTTQTLTCNAAFSADVVANGQQALSDVIDLTASNNLSAKTFVASMRINPQHSNITDKQKYYTQFCGITYVSTEDEDDATHLENFAKIVTGKIPEHYMLINRVDEQPLKSPYIFNKTDNVVKYYYESLGYDVDSIVETWNSEHLDETRKPLLYVLSNSLTDIPIPRSQTYCYETTLQPLSSGLYKFIGANDGIGAIAIDDKLIFVSEHDGLSNEAFLSALLGQIDDSSQLDAEQIRLLSTQSEWVESKSWRISPGATGVFNIDNLSSLSSIYFCNSVTKANANSILGSTFRCEFNNALSAGNPENPLCVSVLPYNSGGNIKLLHQDTPYYKCRVWISKKINSEIDYTTFNYLMLFNPDESLVELSTQSYAHSLSNDAEYRLYPTMQDMIYDYDSEDTEHNISDCTVLGYSNDFASYMENYNSVAIKQLFAVSDLTDEDKRNLLKQIGSNSNLFTNYRSNESQYWTVHGNYLPIVIEGPTKLYYS